MHATDYLGCQAIEGMLQVVHLISAVKLNFGDLSDSDAHGPEEDISCLKT